MKQILTTLLLCVSSVCISQDTIQIPADELQEFILAVDTLESQDSIKTLLINQLEHEIKLHVSIAELDSLIILYKDQEILLLNEQIELHIDRLAQVDKWYNKPWVGAVGGFIGTLVLIHTIDYTLPK